MSLNVGGGRLLAEALADAMDRDLADIPPQENIEELHHFSKKFVRGIKRIQSGKEEKERTADVRALGARAKRWSGLAAALVCVVGLAVVSGVMGRSFRMGNLGSKSESVGDTATADGAPENAVDDAISEEMTEDAADGAADTGTDDNASDQMAGADEKTTPAPDWQEQLLLESVKADQYASWHFCKTNEEGMITLTSQAFGDSGHGGQVRTIRISQVYEVYYEKSSDEWERVYHVDRMMADYTGDVYWREGYQPQDLNMTKAGVYRLVRQVNNYRQVLQLTLHNK